jgi:hypothetical protein
MAEADNGNTTPPAAVGEGKSGPRFSGPGWAGGPVHSVDPLKAAELAEALAAANRAAVDEKIAKITAAFQNLTALEAPGSQLSYAASLPHIARQLVQMFSGAAAPNYNQAASRKQTEAELAQLRKSALDLLNAILSLHQPALDALYPQPWVKENLTRDWGLQWHLRMLAICAFSADTSNIPETAGKGAPQKRRAAAIAQRVAEYYWGYTGNPPTLRTPADGGPAYGPFLSLLQSVFEVLGETASAESQAKAVIQRYRRQEKRLMEEKRQFEARLTPLD